MSIKKSSINIGFLFSILSLLFINCKEMEIDDDTNPIATENLITLNSINVNGTNYNVPLNSNNLFFVASLSDQKSVKLNFNKSVVDYITSIRTKITLKDADGRRAQPTLQILADDKTITISTNSNLSVNTVYELSVPDTFSIVDGGNFNLKHTSNYAFLITTNDVEVLSNDNLLDSIQRQTFDYFWKHNGPVSGMARERTNAQNVTTGGTGFGIMSFIVGVERQFISRSEAVDRLTTIIDFLKNKATRYHGVWSHWIDDATGNTSKFSDNDDGADLVESALLIQGLLTAQMYFNSDNDAREIAIRKNIDTLWREIEWTWFQKSPAEDVLYWHWSPNKGWAINLPIKGYNEALITYVLAASSPTFSIDKKVYDQGWATSDNMQNGKSFENIVLPLGEDYGGPLFLSQYSFLGLDPRKLKDTYADYWQQVVAHTKINRAYCISNPKSFPLYGKYCWGLTSSDTKGGYTNHSPTNDRGVITPTASLSSFPYTPNESMDALRYFYYGLGDKIIGTYGFKDAFATDFTWTATDHLAVDQGPIVVMIENYRTQLIWNLFMKHPDIQKGLQKLAFTIKTTPESMDALD